MWWGIIIISAPIVIIIIMCMSVVAEMPARKKKKKRPEPMGVMLPSFAKETNLECFLPSVLSLFKCSCPSGISNHMTEHCGGLTNSSP